ncbi:MAG: hypothetical protein MRY49_02290 [Candidatus Pacebacteria bacterium]|nr:hypothetical protein [Candidatus Paceibacterota bacterium]
MPGTIMQVLAGGFYLLNKIFLFLSESNKIRKRFWRINAWSVYLLGLPFWTYIFLSERNWIAAALELGGAPAMVMGLVYSVRKEQKSLRWLDHICIIAIVLGLGYSLYDFGGIVVINQYLELGTVTGFLIGTYMLAKEKPGGYLWFLIMNVSNAALMAIQDYYWLSVQQMISFCFVLSAYISVKRTVSK